MERNWIIDKTTVCDNGEVFGMAKITDTTRIEGTAKVYGKETLVGRGVYCRGEIFGDECDKKLGRL